MKTNRFNFIGAKNKIAGTIVIVAIFSSCSNNQLVQQYKELHEHDSLMVLQTQAEDSTIKGYINSMNEIQSNLDEIKSREKILSVNGSEESKTGNNAVKDIKMLDSLIIASNKDVAALHARIKKMDKKNAAMEAIITRMTSQIAAQDTQITALQSNLAKVNDSYKLVTQQFNDSMVVLQNRNVNITNLTNTMNTVYYAVGTLKELKDNKVIDKTGGFIGIGRNSKLKPDFNSSYFTKTDLTKLNVIPLNAKFNKLITTHPTNSYRITGNKTADSLWITDQSLFWEENKYLVVAVK
jgi:hypothetical protein